MCLYPRLIENRKYKANKKNGGIVPAISDNRVLWVPVGCGKCMECMAQEGRKWQQRLLEDIKINKNGKMVTLTFSNESIKELAKEAIWKTRTIKTEDGLREERVNKEPLKGYELDNNIATLAVRRFCERWRKKHKKSIRHWLVTELGHNGTENIHMHGIVWTNEGIKEIEKHWKYGFIWIDEKRGWVNEQTVNYVTKYIKKTDFKHKEYKSKVLTSAGIGANYTESNNAKLNKYKEGEETKEAYITRTGHKMGLNTYWRNKIYTEEEREKLWLEKLDKEIRFVNGKEIDISKGEEEYYKVLEKAREESKKLGYGDDTKNWQRKAYEEERRIMMMQKRTKE